MVALLEAARLGHCRLALILMALGLFALGTERLHDYLPGFLATSTSSSVWAPVYADSWR